MPSWYLMRPELRLSWRLGVRLRLEHFYLMAAIGEFGTTQRVT